MLFVARWFNGLKRTRNFFRRKNRAKRRLPTLRELLLSKERNTFYSRLFRNFKPFEITAANGKRFLVDIAFDQHEAHISFGIFHVKEGKGLAVGVPSFSPETHSSEKYFPLGRIKVRPLTTEKKEEQVLEVFIQGIKGQKKELDSFSEAVGMPWPVFLAKRLVKLAKENGFEGIAIPRIGEQPYLKAPEGAKVQPKEASFPLIAATARALGCKKGKTHYFLRF